jgi:TRAP-type C4-dicarboxylate transport system permease small subunit
MQQRTRRVLRIVFVIVGALFAFLGIATLTLFLILRPPGDHSDALRGGFVYLVLAVVSFFAARRLRPPKAVAQGFEVISKPTGDAETG